MATTLKGTQIAVNQMPSAEANNLLRYNTNGLYFAIAAAADLTNQYVSSSTGNDNNPGTRAAPLKTLARAIERLPNGTTGYIWLYETDTFALRTTTDPTTWGATINYFGSMVESASRALQIYPYGPQSDYYNQIGVGSVLFAGWLLDAAPRPIIEIGHYMYNGKPVGCRLIMGASTGQALYMHGCDIRVTPEARAACAATNSPWTAVGGQEFFTSVTGRFRGCKLPEPISAGGTVTYVATTQQEVEFWQCTINSGSAMWFAINGTAIVNFENSGPYAYDGQGNAHATLTDTVTVNIQNRTAGIVKDSNGIPRNVYSRINF